MAGPFKLRSGNSTPFKELGSSPVKQLGLIKKVVKGGIKVAKKIKKYAVDKDIISNPKWGGKGYYNPYIGKYQPKKVKKPALDSAPIGNTRGGEGFGGFGGKYHN